MQSLLLRLGAMLRPTLLGLQRATQCIAGAYGYHPHLGAPSLTLGDWRFYAPWRFGVWLWRYGVAQPEVFHQPMLIVAASVGVGVLLVGLLVLTHGRQGHAPTTYV